MTPATPNRPRIGIPWRTSGEGRESQGRPWQGKLRFYAESVVQAGGEPVEVPLDDPKGLQGLLPALDGFVLPGSPADVEPAEYGSRNEGLSSPADLPRERTDRSILEHAFAHQKPVLAICYGCQLLNVYLGGTLLQDLRQQTGTHLAHRKRDVAPELKEDPQHIARFDTGSRLASLAGASESVVNSSHHQSVEKPGRGLKITGHAPDGIVESIEWTGDANWIVGVQWHPERMQGDALAGRLFAELTQAARAAREVHAR